MVTTLLGNEMLHEMLSYHTRIRTPKSELYFTAPQRQVERMTTTVTAGDVLTQCICSRA